MDPLECDQTETLSYWSSMDVKKTPFSKSFLFSVGVVLALSDSSTNSWPPPFIARFFTKEFI